MVDSFFTVFSVRRGGKKKKHPSLRPQRHIIAKWQPLSIRVSRQFHTRCLPHPAACMKLFRHAGASLDTTPLCFQYNICQLAAASTQVIRLLKPTMSQEFQDDFPLLTVIYQGNVFLHTDEIFGVIMTMWHGSHW